MVSRIDHAKIIAIQTRKSFGANTIDHKLLRCLYAEYADLDNIDSYLKKASELFPLGNCGLATVFLQQMLGGEIVRGKYAGKNHTFLTLDGQVIDITADQFGGPAVYVGDLRFPWCRKTAE